MRLFNMVSRKEYDKIRRERDYILLSILTYVDTMQGERDRRKPDEIVHEISEEEATDQELMSMLLHMLTKDTDDDYWQHEILRRQNRQPTVMEIGL